VGALHRQPAGGEQHAGTRQLLHELRHVGVELLVGLRAAAVDRHQEPHRAIQSDRASHQTGHPIRWAGKSFADLVDPARSRSLG
jgi:hypothetical protein